MGQAKAQVYCHGDERLAQRQSCFASFSNDSCWKGVGIEIFDKPNWRAMESGRENICLAVDEWMLSRSTDDEKRMECQLSCLQEARVACRQF